jgi:hypothetical protein
MFIPFPPVRQVLTVNNLPRRFAMPSDDTGNTKSSARADRFRLKAA